MREVRTTYISSMLKYRFCIRTESCGLDSHATLNYKDTIAETSNQMEGQKWWLKDRAGFEERWLLVLVPWPRERCKISICSDEEIGTI